MPVTCTYVGGCMFYVVCVTLRKMAFFEATEILVYDNNKTKFT